MLGMLQIITYLLCLYLIFKGAEIFQIAWMSTAENKGAGVAFGIVMLIFSIVAAAGFAYWITVFAEGVSNNMQSLPRMK